MKLVFSLDAGKCLTDVAYDTFKYMGNRFWKKNILKPDSTYPLPRVPGSIPGAFEKSEASRIEAWRSVVECIASPQPA